MDNKLIINKDFFFIRLLFLVPWLYVIFQIFYVLSTTHRFQALSKSNLALAVVYLVTFSILPILFTKLKAPPKDSNLAISFIAFIIVISLTINKPIFVLKDATLIVLQLIFFLIGWTFSHVFDSKFYVKLLIRDGIIFGTFLGIYTFSVDYDLVSPMFGIFATAAYARVKYGREFNFYFFISFLLLNIFWAFGKQTLILSAIAVTIVIMSSSDLKKYQNLKNKFLYRFLILALLIFTVIVSFDYLNTADIKSFAKLNLLLDQIKIGILFSGPLTADLIYDGLDISTAGRVYELLLIYDKITSSIPSFLFGGGLGLGLDLSLKNDYSNLSFTFQETQSVQTLLAFVPSRFGFLGVFFGLYILFKQFKERRFSGNIYVPYILCLILSLLAFSTVFKFHFISFFLGAMLYNVRSRKRQRFI